MALSSLLNHNTMYKPYPQADTVVIEKFIDNMPDHWFINFIELIHLHVPSRPKDQIEQELRRQFVGANDASVKEVTVQQLMKFFYLLMSKELVVAELNFSEHMIVEFVLKIDEGMMHCAEGFQDRLLELYNALMRPKNFTGRLARYREHLVEKTAIRLTNEVHAHNYVFKHAGAYGVAPINSDDPYIVAGAKLQLIGSDQSIASA